MEKDTGPADTSGLAILRLRGLGREKPNPEFGSPMRGVTSHITQQASHHNTTQLSLSPLTLLLRYSVHYEQRLLTTYYTSVQR